MNRDECLRRIRDPGHVWDVLVIGGGASGLGAAVDAASRGYSTVLVEQSDFAKGTSSRSTKLIHGGVRYLRQGHIGLVREALHERGVLRRLAPHLVRDLGFVVPIYSWWEGPFYGLGFKLYDALAGDLGIAPSRALSKKETLARIPTVRTDGLRGGVIYHDAQFDDARLAITLARTLADLGGSPLNYLKVVRFLKANGKICGVVARDEDDPAKPLLEIRARAVINATGVFADRLRRLDRRGARPLAQPSQGVHLVLGREFLPGDDAIMVPHTDDGRVLFAVPWHDRVLVGTTDTPVARPQIEPRPLEEEINFLLRHAARYLARAPRRADVRSMFAGLRPLFRAREGSSTASLSREHVIDVSPSGLVSVIGGKWTTYRRMGEDVVTCAAEVAGLRPRDSQTAELALHGAARRAATDSLSVYGSDSALLEERMRAEPALAHKIHPRLPYRWVEVEWAVQNEMARTVEDILARRTRALFLDAQAALEAAPVVAARLSALLTRPPGWAESQLAEFAKIGKRYLPE